MSIVSMIENRIFDDHWCTYLPLRKDAVDFGYRLYTSVKLLLHSIECCGRNNEHCMEQKRRGKCFRCTSVFHPRLNITTRNVVSFVIPPLCSAAIVGTKKRAIVLALPSKGLCNRSVWVRLIKSLLSFYTDLVTERFGHGATRKCFFVMNVSIRILI